MLNKHEIYCQKIEVIYNSLRLANIQYSHYRKTTSLPRPVLAYDVAAVTVIDLNNS